MNSENTLWVLRWRIRAGRERPVVEKGTARDERYMLGRPTRRAVIESAIGACRKRLEAAREAVAANEQYIADLERLLEREPV